MNGHIVVIEVRLPARLIASYNFEMTVREGNGDSLTDLRTQVVAWGQEDVKEGKLGDVERVVATVTGIYRVE